MEGGAERPTVWWRYIDNVFMIWPHGEGRLEVFSDIINHLHTMITFIAEWSYRSVVFLDVNILVKDGNISTDLYT